MPDGLRMQAAKLASEMTLPLGTWCRMKFVPYLERPEIGGVFVWPSRAERERLQKEVIGMMNPDGYRPAVRVRMDLEMFVRFTAAREPTGLSQSAFGKFIVADIVRKELVEPARAARRRGMAR